MIDSPSLEIGNSRDFGDIHERVGRLVRAIAPGHDMQPIERAFALIESACHGRLAGYGALLTPYHDLGHVLEVVLCSARLLHGLHLSGVALESGVIDAAIVGALLHDSGYLMEHHEAAGTGAQFTLTHVVRGVVFAETHLAETLSPDLLSATGKVILATDHRPVAIMPEYDTPAQRLAAQVTATADLVGQMANREYLERLLLLQFEFKEAGISFFADIHDMLEKTEGFYRMMAARLQHELGGLTPYLIHHFDQARGVRRNYYAESLGRNLDYLARLVREDRACRLEWLKRGGIVDRAVGLLQK